jgi:23S rRNA (cytidine1920-2'-O)/16S rRNA (cytidine1409-2'-O)-methyltransferase
VKRARLDRLVCDRGLVDSRQKAQGLIVAGRVLVNDQPVTKAGTQVATDADIRIKGDDIPYVSRGGFKLEAALDAYQISPEGLTCADFGASTGGFTDCLLQRGAARVYAVDVGYGQLDWKLRQDPRVEVLERTNARHLQDLPEPIALLVGDLSFISLSLVLPAIARVCQPGATCVLLIKPQFEVGRDKVGKGGKVRDPVARQEAVDRVIAQATAAGFQHRGDMESPLPGARSGNVEHLLWLGYP